MAISIGGNVVSAYHPPSLSTVIEEPFGFSTLFYSSRLGEQQRHFSAFARAVESRKTAHGLKDLTGAAHSLTAASLDEERRARLSRLVCRLRSLDHGVAQEDLFSKAEESSRSLDSIEEICGTLSLTIGPSGRRCIEKFQAEEKKICALMDPAVFIAEQERFASMLASLEQLFFLPPDAVEMLEDRNLDIVLVLRALYSSPLYKAFCTSDHHPVIDVLNSIAIGQYTDTDLRSAFEELGRRLKKTDLPIADRIQTLWNDLEHVGINDKVVSTVRHYSLSRCIGMLIPYIWSKIAVFFSISWLSQLTGDERRTLRNTPGAIIDEVQMADDRLRTIRTVALAAPTIGNAIVPEFRAALQALENAQFAGSNGVFSAWVYTNLQNLSHPIERSSTTALMALQDEYPLSFHAITLPQKIPESSFPNFSKNEIQYHLDLLFQNRTTTLGSRGIDHDPGYYLPQRFLDDYRTEIKAIAHKAFDAMAQESYALPVHTLKKAYIKLFHVGLTRLHEKASFDTISARTQCAALNGIRSTICASCIDRGGGR